MTFLRGPNGRERNCANGQLVGRLQTGSLALVTVNYGQADVRIAAHGPPVRLAGVKLKPAPL